ncbi:MAG: N-6 DNA methylase, partial [Candidatus Nanopelagicales bacterium]
PVLTHMRSIGARKGLGEFHTPADVAELMAGLLHTELPEPGQAIHEPAAGSGGLVLAAAQNIRHLGGDPARYTWVMGDIDALAISCAATNALIWGLGDNVLAYRADALAEPDAPRRAVETRRAVLDHHRRVIGAALPLAAFELTIRDLAEVAAPRSSEDAA